MAGYTLKKVEEKLILQMATYFDDPVAFGYDILGTRHTDYQQTFAYAVADNDRVAWRSCHGIGKTFTVTDLVIWWLLTRYNSQVITTASIWRQVKLLWTYIGEKIKNADLASLGWHWPINVLDQSIKFEAYDNWYAMGLSSDKPDTLEGHHADYLLYIVDEAKIVPRDTFASIEGAMTSEHAKLVIVSTPHLNNEGYFFDIWNSNKPFEKFHTSAFDSPNVKAGRIVVPELVTSEWIEARKTEWGENSPEYQAKVLGNFPETTEDTLIAFSWAERAAHNIFADEMPVEISCDVARYGTDKTVIMRRNGNKAAFVAILSKLDNMAVAGRVRAAMQECGATIAKIDVIGLGSGPVDRLREQRVRVMAVNGAEAAIDKERFFNVRAEGYWNLREKLKNNVIAIPNDPELLQELAAIKYKYRSDGRILIEEKDEIKKRLGRSPDKADALMYLFLPNMVGNLADAEMIDNSYSKGMEW